MNEVYCSDNLSVLRSMESESIDLIYIDPPFNTGKTQKRKIQKMEASSDGTRIGFGGKTYKTETKSQELHYNDSYSEYIEEFLEPRIIEAYRILKNTGTFYLHLDYREVHYAKVMCDKIFGRENFLNEIIWAYDYGAKSKSKWPTKHDNILVYVKDINSYFFDSTKIDRIPYMAPGLVGPDKAEIGKLPTDCFSDDTEILTINGWKLFDQLVEGESIATVSENNDLYYTRKYTRIKEKYIGKMIQFKSKAVDALVTPNHNMWCKPKNHSKFDFIKADQIKNYSTTAFTNKLNFNLDMDFPTFFEQEKVDYYFNIPNSDIKIPMDIWCKFLGLYISEGSSRVDYKKYHYEVSISQTKKENLEYIESVLKAMKVSYYYNSNAFCFTSKPLAVYLKTLGKSFTKYIPLEMLYLPKSYLQLLFEALVLGDGSRRVRNTLSQNEEITYHTTSERLANQVQELILKLGYNSNITCTVPKNPRWNPKFTVSRRISVESHLSPKHITEIDYNGYIHCVNVEPEHRVVVRRNGKPLICGNCWWMTIVPTNGKEKTGYPTQKPEKLLERILNASCPEGGTILDFFAGSGTTAIAAAKLNMNFILIDNNKEAIDIIKNRINSIYPQMDISYYYNINDYFDEKEEENEEIE